MSDALVNREHADRYYAVRRGPGRGVYTTWPDAMNAGWYRQQGLGHAARFTDLDNAEAWMSGHVLGGNNFVYKAVRR